MDSQLQSCLFRLPVEIRRHVYSHLVGDGVHVYLHRGRVCVSTCVTPQTSDDYYCFDRRSSGDPPSEVWARRLESSWALHWRCEEVALGLDADMVSLKAGRDPVRAAMQSCKKTREEVMYLMAEKCRLHITDLTTLAQLLYGFREHPSNCISARAFTCVRRLSLAFRPPLGIYKTIEQPAASTRQLPAMWTDMWRLISKLRHLQSLAVYLDHDSQASWSLVNEAAVLTPLLAVSHLTTISLPVRPRPPQDVSEASKHAPSTLNITRFTRQRFFTERRQDGTHGIVYEDDARSMFHDPSPSAGEMAGTAEWTMHIWLHGVDLDYCAMDERMGGGCWSAL